MTDLVAELRSHSEAEQRLGIDPEIYLVHERAADEIERLTAHVRACEAAWIDERGWLRAERDRLGRDLTEALNRATAHFGEIQRLRAALERYGKHDRSCTPRQETADCNCGFSEALAGTAVETTVCRICGKPADSAGLFQCRCTAENGEGSL